MNEVVLPPGANWYCSSILICTSDNTIIYGSRKDIVTIISKDSSEAADVRIIPVAHHDNISAVSANNSFWGKPDKYVASAGEDGAIKLWNMNTYTLKSYHKGHQTQADRLAGVCFAGERIVSVTENGCIIVWRFNLDSWARLPNIFDQKVKVKCMSSCPHASWRTAFGLASGLVVVADLRKNGRLLYKMRAHNDDITGLSWCPTPRNIYKSPGGELLRNILNSKSQKMKYMARTDSPPVKLEDDNAIDKEQNAESIPVELENQETDLDGTRIDISKLKINKDVPLPKNGAASAFVHVSIVKKADNGVPSLPEMHHKKLNTSAEQIITPQHIEDDLFSPEANVGSEENALCHAEEKSEVNLDVKMKEQPKIDKKNPWGNVEFHDSDDETCVEATEVEEKVDEKSFLLECGLVKQLLERDSEDSPENVAENDPIIESEDVKDKELVFVKPDEKDVKSVKAIDEPTPASPVKESDLESNDNHASADEENDHLSENTDLYFSNQNSETSENTTEHLLASACKGGIICIWRAATDGRMQLQLSTLRQRSANKKKRDDKKSRWISLCWAKPCLLLSSSSTNEVYSWNLLPTPGTSKEVPKSALFKPRVIHGDHTACIFAIVVPYRLFAVDETDTNWRADDDMRAWTVSKDKWLFCTSLGRTRHIYAAYPCIGGAVLCMTVSPVDPSRLAIGASDATLGVLDLNRLQPRHIEMDRFWDKVKSKVTSLSWHPTKENYIAFATNEGRVGQYDICKRVKSPILFSSYHRQVIYKIQWGPLPDAEDGIYGLYSASGGDLVIHDPSKPLKEPLKILHDLKVTNFSWKPDYSTLAVGTRDGHVKLLHKNLVPFQTLYMATKSVFGFAWHPLATVMDNGESPYADYLAVAANEQDIHVYKCAADGNKQSEVVATLQGHTLGIKALDWCPHISGRLASASEDGTIMVWDVPSQTPLALYKGPYRESILCICWSPLDADLIIAGGKDCTFRIWRITSNPVPPNIKAAMKDEKEVQVPSKTVKPASNQNGNKKYIKVPIEEVTIESVIKLPPFPNRTRYAERHLLLQHCEKLFNDLVLDEDFRCLPDFVEPLDNSFMGDPMKLISSKQEALPLINFEQSEYKHKHMWVAYNYVSLMKGDLVNTIEKAREAQALDPWIVSLAPMVSHEVWLDLCESYADQLRDRGEALLASSYYLACHKVIDAINVLCNKNYFKEALALARSRLPNGDKVISSIIDKWLYFEKKNGQYEFAAQIYIKLKRLSEAAEMLNKRSDIGSLELAAKLAKRADNQDLITAVNLKLDNLKKQEELNKEVQLNDPNINIYESRFEALMAHQEKAVDQNDDNSDTESEIYEDSNTEVVE